MHTAHPCRPETLFAFLAADMLVAEVTLRVESAKVLSQNQSFHLDRHLFFANVRSEREVTEGRGGLREYVWRKKSRKNSGLFQNTLMC